MRPDPSSQTSDDVMIDQQILAEAEKMNSKRDREDGDFGDGETQGDAPRVKRRHRSNAANSIKRSPVGLRVTRAAGRKPKNYKDCSPETQKKRRRRIADIVKCTGLSAKNFVPANHRPEGDPMNWHTNLLKALGELASLTRSNTDLAQEALKTAVQDRVVTGSTIPTLSFADVQNAIRNISDEPRVENNAARSPTFALERESGIASPSMQFEEEAPATSPGNVRASDADDYGRLLPPASASIATSSRRAGKQPVKQEPIAQASTHVGHDLDDERDDRLAQRYAEEQERQAKYRVEENNARYRRLLSERRTNRWEALQERGDSTEDPISLVAADD